MVTVLVVAPPIVAIGSLNVTATLSPASAFPAVPAALFVDDIEIGTGPAPSAGAAAANEPWRFKVSTIPLEVSSATVNVPTAVFAVLPPSASVSVAGEPHTLTQLREPPDGTLLSGQPVVQRPAPPPGALFDRAAPLST